MYLQLRGCLRQYLYFNTSKASKYFCTSKASGGACGCGCVCAWREYLHFCTSKASKLSTCACIGGGAGEFAGECVAVLGGLFGGAYRYV